jgi:glycosyltransferase involved in cell wall biosynthesis
MSAPAIPKLSVCLLVYNHGHILAETITSVLEQDFRDFELILSDDCSTDSSWRLIQDFASKDSRIRAVRTPRNLRMPGNANFAFGHARAPFIALLHHDDLCAPQLLRRWLEIIERYPSVGFVSNAYARYMSPRVDHPPFAEFNNGRAALEHFFLPRWDCVVRGTAMIRRSAWQDVGGMRDEFGMLADIDLWFRLAARWDIGCVAEPLIIVRHDRPADYDRAYDQWSWKRLRLLFEIHGTARREYFGGRKFRLRTETLKLRFRVSTHQLYWLSYAVAKRRWSMLSSSHEVENDYEFAFARWTRRALGQLATRLA